MARTVSYTSGGKPITAELFEPATPPSGTTGVVVVAYGSDGLVDNDNGPWKTMIEGYARDLADAGFLALIPDYLARTGTRPGLSVLGALDSHTDKWQEALEDGIKIARGLPSVDPARVGLLGFSLGGYLGLRARSKGKALSVYFPPFLGSLGSSPKLEQAQVHQGTNDSFPTITKTTAAEIKKTLTDEGTPTNVFLYPGAGHGFVGSDAANTKARDDSRTHTLDLFKTHL